MTKLWSKQTLKQGVALFRFDYKFTTNTKEYLSHIKHAKPTNCVHYVTFILTNHKSTQNYKHESISNLLVYVLQIYMLNEGRQ